MTSSKYLSLYIYVWFVCETMSCITIFFYGKKKYTKMPNWQDNQWHNVWYDNYHIHCTASSFNTLTRRFRNNNFETKSMVKIQNEFGVAVFACTSSITSGIFHFSIFFFFLSQIAWYRRRWTSVTGLLTITIDIYRPFITTLHFHPFSTRPLQLLLPLPQVS